MFSRLAAGVGALVLLWTAMVIFGGLLRAKAHGMEGRYVLLAVGGAFAFFALFSYGAIWLSEYAVGWWVPQSAMILLTSGAVMVMFIMYLATGLRR